VEDEIDLRVYINVLFRYKWVILALTLVAGAIAFVVSSLLPPMYQATAVVVITRPLYQFQFSPAIQNLPENVSAQLTGKAGLDLASSDTMLQELFGAIGNDFPPQERSLVALKGMLRAAPGGDPSIVKLTVSNHDPQRVARIANAWVGLYIRQVNDLYGQSAEQQKFFEGQLAQAQSDLDKADQALVDFQKRNDAAILQAQLFAKQNALSNYLIMNESLNLLLQNVHSLQEQLARQPADAPSTLGNDLSTLMLQINAFNAQSSIQNTGAIPGARQSDSQSTANTEPQITVLNAPSGTPIQLQLPATGSLSNKTTGQQAVYLADLAKTIEARQVEAKKQSDALPAEIMALQGQLQEINTENAQLKRQRDLAQSVYTTLAQKVGETRIAAQETSGRVRLASSAAVPERPLGGRLKNTAIAAALGLFVGVLGAFVIEYLRQPKVEPAARPAPVPS
jgi:uncharacterized protein involved in exopolysaccharide biosynthesis